MTRTAFISLILALFFVPFSSFAQVKPQNRAVFMRHYVKLDTIITNAEQINLTQQQKKTIQKSVKSMQDTVSDLQWDHQSIAAELSKISEKHPVNKEAATKLAKQLMDIETKMKMENFKLHIEIKNTLSISQYEKLVNVPNG